MMHTITVKTTRRCQLLDITDRITNVLGGNSADAGAVHVYVPHTTAGVLINENADPSVAADILAHLEKLVPPNGNYRHSEGNSDAHIKACIVGSSVIVPLEDGRPALGTWQGIYFAEFDGPRQRRVHIKILREAS